MYAISCAASRYEFDEEEDDDVDEESDEEFTPKAKKTATGARKRAADERVKASGGRTGAKPKKAKGPTQEQERRRMGDAMKAQISFEKWAIEARTHVCVDVPYDTFEGLIVPNASRVTPDVFSEDSPVVVARLNGAAAGEVFGKTKLRGGSMYKTWSADCVDVVYYPATATADIWWTMA